jgi:hypothetical protein
MSTRAWTVLILAAWLATVFLLIVGTMVVAMRPARAADSHDCTVYANRGSAAALKQLLGFPFIDVAAGRFLYRKAYTFCLNQDELPELVFTPEEQPIVDGLPAPKPRPEPPAGSVPAVGEEVEVGELGKEFTDKPVSADMKAAWAKCAKRHPRGWDAKTKTIAKRVGKKWIRVPCP